ncbi:MAG: hypothetical protein IPP25_18170 [Saprospiraceae bacterium]|nr:hypothetical protein [Candidatus Opimibacter skivensis]
MEQDKERFYRPENIAKAKWSGMDSWRVFQVVLLFAGIFLTQRNKNKAREKAK